MSILCRLGTHRPMKPLYKVFRDNISGEDVLEWECNCGIYWLASKGSLFRCRSTYQPNQSNETT
jgi:hypothetical protein